MRSLNLVFKRSEWSGGARFVRCRVISRGYVAILPGCGVALLPACPVDLRCPECSVVEYPGKVACPSGRRCSTRNAVWCHSHPGFKSQRYRRCRPAPLGPGGFVIPEWCVRACCLLRRWCFGRRRARPPARLGVLTSFGAAPRSPPRPSGPSGALHTSGAWSLMHGSARRLVVRPGPVAVHGRCGLALGCCMLLSCGCQSAISHVIPVSLFQTLNSYRWNCNVFVRSQKMTEINYVRNLSGACLTVARGAPQLGLPIPPHRQQWGFYAMRSPLTACRRRVGALDGVISPDW